MFRNVFILMLLSIFSISAGEVWDTQQRNVFVYGEGNIEIDIQINSFENIAPNVPIQASVMVTHPSTSVVDAGSFRQGGKPLKVEFVRNVPMSEYSNLQLSIYNFQIEGMPSGAYSIPPVKVKVAGNEYESLPLDVEIP